LTSTTRIALKTPRALSSLKILSTLNTPSHILPRTTKIASLTRVMMPLKPILVRRSRMSVAIVVIRTVL
jgi:hypothetical protein